MVFLDGRWQVVDTTPSQWAELESQHDSALQPIYDLFFWVWYRFNLAVDQLRQGLPPWLLWLLLPLAALLWWRLKQIKRLTTSQQAEEVMVRPHWPGQDSDFYRAEQRLTAAGWPRQPSESLQAWLERLAAEPECQHDIASLQALLPLHYQYRFAPRPQPQQPAELPASVASWLAAPENNPLK